MVEIIAHNLSQSVVKCAPDELRSIVDHFSYEVPGYQHIKKSNPKKFSAWDGKVKLVNNKGVFRTGMIPLVEQFSTTIIKSKPNTQYLYDTTDLTAELQENFANVLQQIDTSEIRPRADQIDMVDKILAQDARAVAVSPTGTGKSLMIFFVAYVASMMESKSLIIVPTIMLAEQLRKEFDDYALKMKLKNLTTYVSHHKGYQPPIIKNGDVLISTWQTAKKMNEQQFAEFDALIVDEAHLAEGKTITAIVDQCINCYIRLGLTGTIKDSITNPLVLQGLFGPIIQGMSTMDHVNKGNLVRPKITVVNVMYSKDDKEKYWKRRPDYHEEMEIISTHDARNKLVVKLADKLAGNTLVLFKTLKHGRFLHGLSTDLSQNKQSLYLDASSSLELREHYKQLMENEQNVIQFASLSLFSTGINIKNLHNIIFAAPSKTKVRLLQSIGRALRTNTNKTSANIYDIVDVFSLGKKQNITMGHAANRMEIYIGSNFDVAYKKVEL